jgi:hypothetical protein
VKASLAPLLCVSAAYVQQSLYNSLFSNHGNALEPTLVIQATVYSFMVASVICDLYVL